MADDEEKAALVVIVVIIHFSYVCYGFGKGIVKRLDRKHRFVALDLDTGFFNRNTRN